MSSRGGAPVTTAPTPDPTILIARVTAVALLSTAAMPPQDPLQAYLGNLAPASRTAVAKRLRAVALLIGVDAAAFPWHELRSQHVEDIKARLLAREAAPATVNLTLATLRGIARYARNLNVISAEEYARLSDVKPACGTRLPAGRSVAPSDLWALVEACAADPTSAGARDAAILATLYVGGLRRAELAALDLADYTADPPRLRVRHGKGNKERLVPLTPAAAAALDAWLALRGRAPGSLFMPLTKGGGVRQTRLTSGAVYKALQKRAREAGVAHVSPHDFRRTFVDDMLDAQVDMGTVRQLTGRASVVATARYDHRGEATKRKAVAALHFPTPRQRV